MLWMLNYSGNAKKYRSKAGDIDKDFERILHLTEIIKAYESLVEFLLEPKEEVYTSNIKKYLQTTERNIIVSALKATGGNVKKAAENLNTPRPSLVGRIKYFNIETGDYR